MRKRAGLAFVLLAVLFLVMNRGAYKGYFSDDEVDNISWTPYVTGADFAKALVNPRFHPDNFRPVGHFYFHAMEANFGLDFPKYVAGIQAIHLLNVLLLWILLGRLGASALQAGAASFAFGLHVALFEAVWKPMYVFDVLCATMCLISILCYVERRWVLSFLAFWLAYKSKELAVMLPAVLACYELWLGKRRWKPLAPFFLVSLSFGLQGILLNPNKDNEYTFRFTPAALARTSVFYSRLVLLVPYAGFALLAVPFFTRNRRAWFGLAASGLLFFPLLFLPGRLYSAYCYVPFLGLAIALSAVNLASRTMQVAAAAVLLLWMPWDYHQLRLQRRAKLAKDDEVRAWMTTLGNFARTAPPIDAFVYSGAPAGFQHWGVEGALKYFFKRSDLEIRFAGERDAPKVMQRERFAMLTWDWGRKQLTVAAHTPETPDAPYIKMDPATPVWQLGEGWFELEGTYRWMRPTATAKLGRPKEAKQFELRVNIGADQMRIVGPQTVRVMLGNTRLEPRRLAKLAWQSECWDLPPGEPGNLEVRFVVEPGFKPDNDPRTLGLAVGGFGFVTEHKP